MNAFVESLERRTMLSVAVEGGVPALSSRPRAAATLYLDFDGDFTLSWLGSYHPLQTRAFGADTDASEFSDRELALIREIWDRVAEAYSPFDVNVTTVDPGSYDVKEAYRVVVGGKGNWSGDSVGLASQWGFSEGWDWDWNTGWVFSERFLDSKFNQEMFTANVANGIAHEAGHGFGLGHYDPDDEQNLTPGRYPLMLTRPVQAYRRLWWSGTTIEDNGQPGVVQDDLATLTGVRNGFGYRIDDHVGTPDPLSGSGTINHPWRGSGVIEQMTDRDAFSFTVDVDGTVDFNVKVHSLAPMLDATVRLETATGGEIVTEDTSRLGEGISEQYLTAGTYRLVVGSHGGKGDVGQYTIAGTFTAETARPPDTTRPAATLSTTGVTVGGATSHRLTVRYSDNVAVDVSDLDSNDVLVGNGRGYAQLATFIGVDTNSDGTPRTATYRIAAPGGTWDASDNGTYIVTVQPGEVSDTSGNFVPVTAGEFQVNIGTTVSPTISVVSPSVLQALPVAERQRVVVYGTGFTSGSTLRFHNGLEEFNSRPEFLTVLSPSAMEYYISVGTTPRTWTVRVVNGGSISDPYTFSTSSAQAVAPPTISPNGGTHDGPVQVSLATATAGAAIRYTLDGTEPTTLSTLYSGAFALTASATVRARAFKAGQPDSAVSSAAFTVQNQPTLQSLSITGPDSLNENSFAAYVATAHYSNGSSRQVIPTWSENSGATSMSGNGVLTAGPVDSDTGVRVSASYSEGGVTVHANKDVVVANTGSPQPPAILLQTGNITIRDGQSSPVDFGSVPQGGVGRTITFTVYNDGGSPLEITQFSVPPGFSLTERPASSLPAFGSDTFTLRLDTVSPGAKSGQIGIFTNDPDEGLFDFPVAGHVAPPPPTDEPFRPLWGKYLGGSQTDTGTAVAVDAAGNIYVAGATEAGGGDWVSGGYDTSFGGGQDAFVVKLDPFGNHLWSTYLGGAGWDQAKDLAVDGAGNVYVAGTTGSSGWVSRGFDTTAGVEQDAFVAKLGPDGSHLWSTYLGGDRVELAFGIALDASAGVFVVGYTASAGWVSGGTDATLDGNSDGYLVKLNTDGTHAWSQYVGGSREEDATAVVADAAGNIYVVGGTQSAGWVAGGYDTTLGRTSWDGFAAKFGPQGGMQWSTYLGGDDITYDAARNIALGPADALYVVGTSYSAGWITGGFDSTHNGTDDGFVARLTAQGQHVWSSYLGGSGSDYAEEVGVDPAGNVYVSGTTRSTGWTSGGFDIGHNGDFDQFIVRLDVQGSHRWSTFVGGTEWDHDGKMTVDAAGNILLAASTQSFNWIDGATPAGRGTSDAFLVKLAPPDTVAPSAALLSVTPDPRSNPVDLVTIVFNEPVRGFDISDLRLSREEGTNLLTPSQTLSSRDNLTWILGNLAGITGAAGPYSLLLASQGSGITDTSGNSLLQDARDTWVVEPLRQPDLTPFQPPMWPDTIIVSSRTGTNSEDGPLHAGQPLYVDWAFVNQGTAATGAGFTSDLWIDGTNVGGIYTESLAPGQSRLIEDHNIGALPAGTYTLEIRVDTHDVTRVAESDEGNNTFRRTITVETRPVTVVGRYVFYNRSTYDGNNNAADPADDGAIATHKQALLPGQAASFANVTSYSRGINGVMIDVAGLSEAAAPSPETFVLRFGPGGDPSTWAAAPAPSSVTIRRGAGVNGSDRVTLVWPDGAIRNTWLRVTVKANARTGLAEADVFYFGNLVGETGDPATPRRVSTRDVLAVRRNFRRARQTVDLINPTNPYDFNRDGAVNVRDLAVVRSNLFRTLTLLTPAAVAAKGSGKLTSSMLDATKALSSEDTNHDRLL